jgi:hypothetical protein
MRRLVVSNMAFTRVARSALSGRGWLAQRPRFFSTNTKTSSSTASEKDVRDLNDPKRLKEDHAHCVHFVRDRDREGYRKYYIRPERPRYLRDR